MWSNNLVHITYILQGTATDTSAQLDNTSPPRLVAAVHLTTLSYPTMELEIMKKSANPTICMVCMFCQPYRTGSDDEAWQVRRSFSTYDDLIGWMTTLVGLPVNSNSNYNSTITCVLRFEKPCPTYFHCSNELGGGERWQGGSVVLHLAFSIWF